LHYKQLSQKTPAFFPIFSDLQELFVNAVYDGQRRFSTVKPPHICTETCMKLVDHLVSSLKGNVNMLTMTLADFSDAELLQRPVPGANSGNWQIGHVILSEYRMMTAAGAKMPELPAGFAEKYGRDTAKNDDASAFLKKDELLAAFTKTRDASVAFAQGLNDEQLDAAAPENIRRLAPTVADLLGLLSGHVTMHIGQLQVLRRKLSKPVLF
jgi:hypothetical protein